MMYRESKGAVSFLFGEKKKSCGIFILAQSTNLPVNMIPNSDWCLFTVLIDRSSCYSKYYDN